MTIRNENKKDYFEVENLVREAFWNKYRPGCMEHFVLHNFRDKDSFVKDLDLIIEEKGKIIAQIMYAKAKINTDDNKEVEVLVFGPVSVLPEYQGKGYGDKIIRFSLDKAKELGFGAVAITGNADYYSKFGFVPGSKKDVYYEGISREEETPFFLVKELVEGYLDGVVGTYSDPVEYFVDKSNVDKFDKKFKRKVKERNKGQLF